MLATYETRLTGEVRRKHLTVFKLTPDASDWEGDPAQWRDVFEQYFASQADLPGVRARDASGRAGKKNC